MSPPPASEGSFKQLWKEQYGEDLTDKQAEEYEDRLVRLLKLLIDLEMAKERTPP